MQDLDRTREGEIPVLEDAKKNFALTKTQRKGAVTPQVTEPKLPPRAGGSPLEAWVGQQRFTTGTGALATPLWEGPPWSKPFWSLPLT